MRGRMRGPGKREQAAGTAAIATLARSMSGDVEDM